MLPLILLVLAAPKEEVTPSAPQLPSKAAVFVSSPDESAGARVEAELNSALAQQSVPLVNVPALFPLPARDPAGDKLVKEARQAWDDLDYEAAGTKWNEALEYFAQHPEVATGKTLADAHFFVGALALLNGGKSQAKKAQEEFARALLHNPALTCDPDLYGAEVKKVFDKASAEVEKRETGALAIESSPAGAEATLRGKVLGRTPIADAPTLPIGRHLVLFSLPGYEPTGVYADLQPDGAVAHPTLKPAPGYAELRDAATTTLGKGLGAEGQVPPDARKLADVVKARFLVVSDGASAEVWDVETGNRLTGLSLAEGELDGSATKIAGFIKNPAPAVVAAADGASKPLFEGPVYKQWWFWTAVGVVVVGGATAGGVAAASNSGGRPFNVALGIP